MNPIRKIKVVVISFILTFVSIQLHAQTKYVQENKDLASALSIQYGIPATIILGIAFVESGGGNSKNSKVLKNHFGIVGKNQIPNYKSVYKSFDSVKDSYIAFCEMVSRKKYYANLKGSNDHSAWISAMAIAGYSTQPETWKQKITAIIKKINLTE